MSTGRPDDLGTTADSPAPLPPTPESPPAVPPPPSPLTNYPPTPLSWRLAIAAGVVLLAAAAILSRSAVGPRGLAVAGVVCFIGLTAALSANLRAVNWRTVGVGILIQLVLAIFILRLEL